MGALHAEVYNIAYLYNKISDRQNKICICFAELSRHKVTQFFQTNRRMKEKYLIF